MKNPADIGLIGLAVMGENLILNMERNGFRVAVFNRTTDKIDRFLEGRANGRNIIGANDVAELCRSVRRPRKIMLMVKAGQPVDDFIEMLLPHLEPGDIIIDGGNSQFQDSIRRTATLRKQDLRFVGAGISGGEEGALNGPSIMPGGDEGAWPEIKPIFQAIAAKAGNAPCCEWVGGDGAGHFVKMVHNGIEYSDMQLICEIYHIMTSVLIMTTLEMGAIFRDWNKGPLNSYLIEITSRIFEVTDDVSGRPVVDLILDRAGQKGTGKWTSVVGLDLGVPIPQITEAVFARCMSALKDERIQAANVLAGPVLTIPDDRTSMIAKLHDALYAAKICSYAQGFHLLAAAAAEYDWDLDLGQIAMLWREGCIIRAAFLEDIRDAFARKSDLSNLLLDDHFTQVLGGAQSSWRNIVKTAIDYGVPTPSLSSALSYYDSYRCNRLPANLLQAQRDFFGAHTYERIDRPRGEFFHTNWTGRGGDTSSTSYNA